MDRDSLLFIAAIAVTAAVSLAAHVTLRRNYVLTSLVVAFAVSIMLVCLVFPLIFGSISNIWPIACALYVGVGFIVGLVVAIPVRMLTRQRPPTGQ